MAAIGRVKRPAFVAEWTLGKLARWLRLAGFDTLYDTMPPDYRRLSSMGRSCERLVLTRTKHVADRLDASRCLLIHHNEPIDQVRQVMQHFELHRRDLAPFTRCSDCNCLLRPAEPPNIQTAVPDYILQSQERFLMCDQCHRVFWPGSHGERMLVLFDQWFDTN